VAHPDTFDDVAAYRELGSLLVLENMDRRKHDGRTVEELARWFDELPEARFCLDVAHAWAVDQSMTVAHELLDAFASRLSHLHVSSVDESCDHTSLTSEHETLFAPVLGRCVDVPWILEAELRAT
jgi:sugar phosphate isomerase/epimerase